MLSEGNGARAESENSAASILEARIDTVASGAYRMQGEDTDVTVYCVYQRHTPSPALLRAHRFTLSPWTFSVPSSMFTRQLRRRSERFRPAMSPSLFHSMVDFSVPSRRLWLSAGGGKQGSTL
jgi:hypothetical protein